MPPVMANFFSGLTSEQTERLQQYLEMRVCEPETEIVHLGAVAEDMYFVLEGEGKMSGSMLPPPDGIWGVRINHQLDVMVDQLSKK